MKRYVKVSLLILFASIFALAAAACCDTVTGDITLYAKWNPITYKVTFESDGGSAVTAARVIRGYKITEPTAPTKAGYAFGGWYKESGLNNLWDFSSDTVTGDITLYAKWNPISYTVTFNSNGGSTVAEAKIAYGVEIIEPTAPTKEGYAFDGWYKESGLNNLWDFSSDTVTGDITLYAKWELAGTEGLTYALNSGNASYSVTGYTGNTKDIIIPATYNGLPVTSIADSAFQWKSNITSVFIPSGVTSIGGYAFYDCTALSSVVFGAGSKLENIGDRAFQNCHILASIEIPASVTSIGEWAFVNCNSLASIDIPAGVISIGDGAFYRCDSLASIEIPASVTSIGSYAFQNCHILASIEIPASVTSIGEEAFRDCNSLASIDIPAGVTSIGYATFYGCNSLASIDIPAGVTSIGKYAFYNCSSLVSIDIPAGVTSIGYRAFYGCSSLVSIEIPASVTEIDDYAFCGCSGLKTIIMNGVTPPSLRSYSYAFDYTPSDMKIYVPSGSEAAYKSASGWSYYKNKITAKA